MIRSATSGRRLLTMTLWCALVLLSSIGVTISVARGISVFESGYLSDGYVSELSRLDQWNIGAMAFLLGLKPGTDAYREIDSQSRRLLGKFNHNPVTTLLHVLPAVVFMVLLPLQFSNRIRSRHTRWHRWSGRTIVVLAIPIGVSGLFFGLLMPFSGALEASVVAVFGGLFFVSLLRGFVAIRKRDIARHREWMIRMCSVALGVSTMRVASPVLALLTQAGPEVWFGHSVWIGFGTTVAAGEAWIRYTRHMPGGAQGVAVTKA